MSASPPLQAQAQNAVLLQAQNAVLLHSSSPASLQTDTRVPSLESLRFFLTFRIVQTY